ncbi:MAG: hypothetical protein Q9193_006254, partial [Seirophora villosa]
PIADDDNAQRWLIAPVSTTEAIIINNGTGTILSATKDSISTIGTPTPPYNQYARWILDGYKFGEFPDRPVLVKNVGRKNTALDLSRSKSKAGTPILSFPIHKTPAANQAWLFEYLEGPPPPPAPPAPEPPAPEPPAPEPPAPSCDFQETDQQALRGNVVDECLSGLFSSTLTESAQGCYDNMKQFLANGVQSYVFIAYTDPGSPGGGGDWGHCSGYKPLSYHFLVANSSGTAFGGDITLPYEGPPAPEPPAPSCDFQKSDQQALRGNVIDDCVYHYFGKERKRNAQECYEWCKRYEKEWGVRSYVFWSALDPGSPNGWGDLGDCRAYQTESYHYFVGNSSGIAFGGDLSLPYN